MTGPLPNGRETGAALLAIMLVVVVAAAFALISKLNSSVRQYVRQTSSVSSLSEAKAALIGYAVNYPEGHPGEGPGYLPCPDISNNGSAGGSCSFGGGTTLGRLPWKTLETSELRDHVGERLWYAVSENYKNNPKVLASLNSDAPGTLDVNGEDDIVAVVFSPGAPVDGQDRAADPLDVTNYLEDDNADGDALFVTRAGGDFNDQLVTITRRELMQVVEKRVLGEVKLALTRYRQDPDRDDDADGVDPDCPLLTPDCDDIAYPWLAAFADPKAAFNNPRGSHNGSNNALSLTDTTADFVDQGVQAGDRVINTSDGSVAAVTSVTATTLSLSSLNLGVENDFDDGDEYVVAATSNAAELTGFATSGSSGTLLNDTGRDFLETGVSPGDLVDNLDDGSSGTVAAVTATSITVAGLTGGGSNSFASGDRYRIRSDRGTATAGSTGLVLEDSERDFVVMGVQAGDLVVNTSDGSFGRVSTVAANTLTLDALYLGAENDFDSGESYYLPRYNSDGGSREGLLSLHESGKHFATGFGIDWDARAANGATVNTSLVSNYPDAAYQADLIDKAEHSSGNTGTVAVAADEGQCVWVNETVAECLGIYWDPNFPIQGTVTSGWNTSVLTDSNADFSYTAVKQGDLVSNFDDEIYTGTSGTTTAGSGGEILEDTGMNFNAMGVIPYYHFIHNNSDADARGLITEIIDDNTLRVVAPPGRPAMDMDPGENYQIFYPQQLVVDSVASATQLNTQRATSTAPDLDSGGAEGVSSYQEFYQINVATGRTPTRTVDAYYSPGYYLVDAGADFGDIEPGDIVYNISDDAYGVITYVDVPNDWLQAQLYASDGSTRSFNGGETYRIYYNHDVNTRRYEFRARFTGASNIHSIAQVRKRDVCLGYTADCSSFSANAALPLQDDFVVIKDLDVGGNIVASAEVDTPATGATGSVRIADLDYFLDAGGTELPSWFIKNKWHQYVYVAYSDELVPGGSGGCTAGSDCLNVTGNLAIDDREALVLSAGSRLDNGICQVDSLAQDRGNARVCDYFENDNGSVGDDSFRKAGLSGSFNDKLIVVSPPLF